VRACGRGKRFLFLSPFSLFLFLPFSSSLPPFPSLGFSYPFFFSVFCVPFFLPGRSVDGGPGPRRTFYLPISASRAAGPADGPLKTLIAARTDRPVPRPAEAACGTCQDGSSEDRRLPRPGGMQGAPSNDVPAVSPRAFPPLPSLWWPRSACLRCRCGCRAGRPSPRPAAPEPRSGGKGHPPGPPPAAAYWLEENGRTMPGPAVGPGRPDRQCNSFVSVDVRPAARPSRKSRRSPTP